MVSRLCAGTSVMAVSPDQCQPREPPLRNVARYLFHVLMMTLGVMLSANYFLVPESLHAYLCSEILGVSIS